MPKLSNRIWMVLALFMFSSTIFASPGKTPLVLKGGTEISKGGQSVLVGGDLLCEQVLDNVRLEIEIPVGDRLISIAPSTVLASGAPVEDPVAKTLRHSFSIRMAETTHFSLEVEPGATGDHGIHVRVLSPRANGDVWGDGYSFFYHYDGKGITEGYRELNLIHSTGARKSLPGSISECQIKDRKPAPVALPPGASNSPPKTAGTVTVTGRWMMYDEDDNYAPMWERLCELLDGSDNHLAWTYTDLSGYFTFPAVSNPGSLYVKAWSETYYNRAGGSDHIWVRNLSGTVYSTYTLIQGGIPDGVYDFGEWYLPNGAINEGAYWAVKKLQDAWRYIYFIGVPDTYPGSIQCQWYPGSTDGPYYRTEDWMIHLSEADPRGNLMAVHESGHALMHNAYGGYFPDNDCPDPHYIQKYGGINCGWTEGWADFLPMVVYNTPTVVWPGGGSLNLETPTWGSDGWDDGQFVEGRVAGALWDIVDSNNEPNNDFYTDPDGTYMIWDALWNSDTDYFCLFWSICSIKRSRDNCLFQNTIDSCTTCSEDPMEDDDDCISSTGEPVPSNYTYQHCTDVDWQYVDVGLDWKYTWETDDLGYLGDTTLTLYASDCSTVLGYNDDKNFGNWPRASKLAWTSDRSARVYIAAREYNSNYGAHRSYDISLSRTCLSPAAATNLDPPDYGTSCTDSPTLSWTGSGRTYDVHIDGEMACSDVSTTSCAASGLSGGMHNWYVTSKNACGAVSYSPLQWFWAASAPSTSVTSAADQDPCEDSGVSIDWSTPSSWGDYGYGSRSFDIYRTVGILVVSGLPEGTTTFNDNTGINGNLYSYRIQAINGCGQKAWYSASAYVADIVDTVPPGNASDLSSPTHALSGCSNNQNFTANWTPATDDCALDGYSVSFSEATPWMPDDVAETGDVTAYTGTAPDFSRPCYFNIRAVDKAGNWSSDFESYGPFFVGNTSATWSSDAPSCIGTPVSFDGPYGQESYLWDFGDGCHFGVRINEINVGEPQFLELFNGAGYPVNLNGWSVRWTNTDGYASTHPLPNFHLSPGAYVQLLEGGGAGNDATHIYIGGDILWDQAMGGSATLYDAGGGAVDFMRFGGDTTPPPPGTGWDEPSPLPTPADVGESLSRDDSSTDSDASSDWCIQAPSGIALAEPVRNADCPSASECGYGACRFGAVISEIYTGTVDAVEIHNTGSSAVYLADWSIGWTETSAGGSGSVLLPEFTLAAGAYVLLIEASGTNDVTHIYLNSDIDWSYPYGGSLSLLDLDGRGVDFVRWGGDGTPPPQWTSWTEPSPLPSPSGSESLARTTAGTDRGSSEDWCLQAPSSPPSDPGPNAACLSVKACPQQFQEDPSRLYSSPGTYTVKLSTGNANGCSAAFSSQVVVGATGIDAAPASGLNPAVKGRTVPFSASRTGGTGPFSYLWLFGDGDSSTLENPGHIYATGGEKTVTLTVTDAGGCSVQKSMSQWIVLPIGEPSDVDINPADPPLKVPAVNRIEVEEVPGATDYHVYGNPIGNWTNPLAYCMTAHSSTGTGTVLINFGIPENTWIVVTATDEAYTESGLGRKSRGVERDPAGTNGTIGDEDGESVSAWRCGVN